MDFYDISPNTGQVTLVLPSRLSELDLVVMQTLNTISPTHYVQVAILFDTSYNSHNNNDYKGPFPHSQDSISGMWTGPEFRYTLYMYVALKFDPKLTHIADVQSPTCTCI